MRIASTVWRRAISLRWVVPALAMLSGISGCDMFGREIACFVPTLRTDEEALALVNAGDRNDRPGSRAYHCAVPVARRIGMPRAYGTLEMEWSGSKHRLYMKAVDAEGNSLDITGAGVEEHVGTDRGLYDEYSYRRVFAGNDFAHVPPRATTFRISVVAKDSREVLDEIEFQYDTVECTCKVGPP